MCILLILSSYCSTFFFSPLGSLIHLNVTLHCQCEYFVKFWVVAFLEKEIHEETQHFKMFYVLLEKWVFPQSLSHTDTIMLYVYLKKN